MNLNIRSQTECFEPTVVFSSGVAAKSSAIAVSAKVFRFDIYAQSESKRGNSVDRLAARLIEEDPGFSDVMARARRRRAEREQLENGLTLKAIRLSRGLSQAELAAKIGMKQPHVARMERGASCPTFQTCRRIAAALGVDMNTLDRALPLVRDSVEEC